MRPPSLLGVIVRSTEALIYALERHQNSLRGRYSWNRGKEHLRTFGERTSNTEIQRLVILVIFVIVRNDRMEGLRGNEFDIRFARSTVSTEQGGTMGWRYASSRSHHRGVLGCCRSSRLITRATLQK